jgi:hypothetical protein
VVAPHPFCAGRPISDTLRGGALDDGLLDLRQLAIMRLLEARGPRVPRADALQALHADVAWLELADGAGP